MISAGEFRNGVTIEFDNNLYTIIEFQHVKPGKGAAFVRTKLKNVISGAVIEKTFNPSEKYPGAEIEKKEMQYLYNDGDLYYFMDNDTYDQIPLNKMDYVPYKSEEEQKLAESMISKQLMIGVFPTEKYVNKIQMKYTSPESLELTKKILEQDKNLIIVSNTNFEKSQEINSQMDDAILKVGNKLELLESSLMNSGNNENIYDKQLDIKVDEYKIETEQNEEKVKNINETIQELQRKKKENEDFFKKYEGEKKVWLDRLKEEKTKDETYSKGFKYLYEAKIIKLILEGIFLEKIQDMVEKEMCEKGGIWGWDIMNEKKIELEKKENEFLFNQNLLKLESREQIRQEKEYIEKKGMEGEMEEKKRDEIRQEWKDIWREIWIPEVKESFEPNRIEKRNLMLQITMDVTFKMFKKIFFDIYKLKNIILSNQEYIIMDKIKNYFPEKNIPGRTQDEIALNQLMNIIDNIKAEEEIIYCDLTPAKQKIEEYSKSNENNKTTAQERLEIIVDKITEVQDIVNNPDKSKIPLVKSSIEEIRKLIKEIPYENERKLFLDNLKDTSRLYDIFLPLNNILMVVSFMTVGKKREKNYDNRITESRNEITRLKGRNNEIAGKWNLIKELKEKIGEVHESNILEKSHEIEDEEKNKCKKVIEEMRKSLNQIIELKNNQQMNYINFYKDIRKHIIRPKDLC